MAAWRRAIELSLTDADTAKLRSIAQSRTEPASRVERARILLAYREDPSFFAVGRALGLHHQTVQRCVERAVAEGPMAALDDRPRPGREPTITLEAKAWLVDLGLPEGEGPRLSARIVDDAASRLPCPRAWTGAGTCVPRQPGAGHGVQNPRPGRREAAQSALLPGAPRPRLCGKDGRSAVRLSPGENPEEGGGRRRRESRAIAVAIISYDEKPGIQAIATTAPDLPPEPGVHATFAREHEYKRHGTVSLLAGIDLVTGKVHALVKDRHRSREFIEFLKLLDAAYPARTAIKLILDNHSAHISKETRAWLAGQPAHRFEFTFTPKHGSWLNLIEGFFSKLARSVLRHIRVASKQELKDRLMAAMDYFNQDPVVHTWTYKLDKAA